MNESQDLSETLRTSFADRLEFARFFKFRNESLYERTRIELLAADSARVVEVILGTLDLNAIVDDVIIL